MFLQTGKFISLLQSICIIKISNQNLYTKFSTFGLNHKIIFVNIPHLHDESWTKNYSFQHTSLETALLVGIYRECNFPFMVRLKCIETIWK